MIQPKMRVKKRDGALVLVRLDEITDRIASLSKDLDEKIIDPVKITLEVVEKIHDGISTSLIDSFTAEICHSKAIEHPHFNILASRLIIGDHQKTIQIIANLKFSQVCQILHTNTDQLGDPSPIISDELFLMSQENKDIIDNMIENDRDFLLDYFGFKTLAKSYLLKVAGKVVETPQHMFMRVALGIHGKFKFDDGTLLEPNFELVKETYDLLSMKYFTHATPTLYNAGTRRSQLFSCFEENTLVDTLNGPKPIKDIEIGDEVITHKGNVKKVLQVHKNPIGGRKVFSLKIRKTDPILVTDNHKIWTYNNGVPDWKSVNDLEQGDYIGIPKYMGSVEKSYINVEKEVKEIFVNKGGFDNRETVEEEVTYDDTKIHLKTSWYNHHLNEGEPILVTKQNSSINKNIEIDEKFCRFLGIWYGDGHICHRTDKEGHIIPIGIGITTSQDNTEMIAFCSEIGSYFGLDPSFHAMKDQNTYQILFNSKILGAVFEHMYGKGFEGKRLHTDIFKYSTKMIVSFIEGLISSDGCISKIGTITLCMANKELIQQIYTLCRLHNFDISSPNKTTGGKLTRHQAYQLNMTCMRYDLENIYKTYTDDRLIKLQNISGVRNGFSAIEFEGFKFLPFESKTLVTLKSDSVYTLGVEDDHSYSIGGIIAENCFLLGMDDSLKSIYKVLGDTAAISKWSGGIGIHIHEIRGNGSYIRGTSGRSDGLVPMLKVYNDTARYINQGGKRSGSFAFYLEPWHADILDFLKSKLPHGDENRRARDLFYALWIPDLFMERVKNNENWSLMCPSECPGLANVYGKDFKKLYEKYEKEGKLVKTMNAQDLFHEIVKSQIETGTPYMVYKDSVNHKSNQKNVGVIRSSNLCVAPETRILTTHGYIPIVDLKDKEVVVWNGEAWSRTTVRQTGENKKLIKVTFSNGSVIQCTEYHKFYIETGFKFNGSSIVVVEAKDLKKEMNLIEYSLPDFHTYRAGPELEHLDKSVVPINYSLSSKFKWFADVCDAYGMATTGGLYLPREPVPYMNQRYLTDVQLMLQLMGIKSEIDDKKEFPFPFLYIPSIGVKSLLDLGFKSNRCLTKGNKSVKPVTVVSVIDEGRTDDTYCFTEPLRNMGMFEGVLTGNCAEIMEYSDANKYACCVLASIVLPTYVVLTSTKEHKEPHLIFDHTKLVEVVKVVARNLNKLIDINYYPVEETRVSNMSERPIGIGVQGLADVFFKLGLAYDSDEALKLDKEIMESIYFAALSTSLELSKRDGPYSTFKGSPISKGHFQFDLWKEFPTNKDQVPEIVHSGRYDWDKLRREIKKHGVRNSLVTALMPTATTSQIMGSASEAFEPITNNLMTRRVKAGEYVVVNPYMASDLIKAGLWNDGLRNRLLESRGSIQSFKEVPDKLKGVYKTVWEIQQKVLIDHAVARAPYIDQSQSLNLYFATGDSDKITKAHFYGWNKGLKTGSYYIRTKPAVNSASFTLTKEEEPEKSPSKKKDNIVELTTEECTSCGS